MKRILIECLAVRPVNSLSESVGSGYLVEKIEESGRMIVKVKLPATVLDEKNENGRTYSRQIMEMSLARAKPFIAERKALGTVDGHPENPYCEPGFASHVVTEAWIEGKYLYNTWEILETSKGQDLRALIDSRVAFGVSIRGLGSTDRFGNVMEDYEYISTDCVGDPSARLRVAPQRVNESVQSQSIVRNNDMKFNTLGEALKFVKEQVILMKSERKFDAMKRAVQVEGILADVKLANADNAQLHIEWTKCKDEVFKEDTFITVGPDGKTEVHNSVEQAAAAGGAIVVKDEAGNEEKLTAMEAAELLTASRAIIEKSNKKIRGLRTESLQHADQVIVERRAKSVLRNALRDTDKRLGEAMNAAAKETRRNVALRESNRKLKNKTTNLQAQYEEALRVAAAYKLVAENLSGELKRFQKEGRAQNTHDTKVNFTEAVQNQPAGRKRPQAVLESKGTKQAKDAGTPARGRGLSEANISKEVGVKGWI